jgi:hypothetical protein
MNRNRIVIIDLDAPRGLLPSRIKGLAARKAASLRRAIAPAMDEQAKQRANAKRASSKSRAGG